MRAVACILFMLFYQLINSQPPDFIKGLDCFRNKQFLWADYYFTKAIIEDSTYIDACFNRALTRYHLNDEKGFCKDLARASKLKDDQALYYYQKVCVNYDTIVLSNGILVFKNEKYDNIIKTRMHALVDKEVVAEGEIENKDTVWNPKIISSDTYNAKYKSGNDSLKSYIVNLLSKTKDVNKQEREGVYCFFVYVDATGKGMYAKLIKKRDEELESCLSDLIKLNSNFIPGKVLGIHCVTKIPLILRFVLK